ncbi:MAG: phospholipid carrier-dependent glycosyltransferase, partial [Prochlorothrix sp.]
PPPPPPPPPAAVNRGAQVDVLDRLDWGMNGLTRNYISKFWQSSGWKIALLGILGLSIGLRFWGLDRFAALVFDEVYFAQFAYNYLHQIPFFDNHPPLGKYCIALGLWLSQFLQGVVQGMGQPIAAMLGHSGEAAVTVTDGFRGLTWGYRWLNALVGAGLPLVGAGLAWELTQRRGYTVLAALLLACDGLLLVESRYALINIYIMAFGLLGQWLFLRSLRANNRVRRSLSLLGAGILLGAAIAVKWNGLGFLLGLGGWGLVVGLGQAGAWLRSQIDRILRPPILPQTLFSPYLWRLVPPECSGSDCPGSDRPDSERAGSERADSERSLSDPRDFEAGVQPPARTVSSGPVSVGTVSRGDLGDPELPDRLLQLHWSDWVIYLGLVPFLFYRLVWVPHLALNSEFTFWQNQAQGLFSHASVGSGQEIHPYCSQWWGWPWLVRPVAYWYETVTDAGQTWVYDVHAIGNPVLWWVSSLTVLFAALILIYERWACFWCGVRRLWSRVVGNATPAPGLQWSIQPADRQLLTYLLVNLGANWLPWIGVSRCLFLYHYMAASIYGFLVLAWLLERWFYSSSLLFRVTASLVVVGVLWGLVYWLPIYLGLPLEESVFRSRIWFRSWY